MLLCFCSPLLAAQSPPSVLRIYHDADYSSLRASAEAIQMGFVTALDEVNSQVNQVQLELVIRDHRGNSNRSYLNLQQFLDDPTALAVLGGVHSPPYIKYRDYINENNILLLVPWAAGGPITRYPSSDNWVFRLSLDDTQVGKVLIDYALNNNCQHPHLLLEQTAWGESNFKTLNYAYSEQMPNNILPVSWFNWSIKGNQASQIVNSISNGPAQCVIFVGNAIEGAEIVKAMAALPEGKRLPIISHWGVTAGNLHQQVGELLRNKVSLAVVQSCFSFQSSPLSEHAKAVFTRAKQLFPERFAINNFIVAEPGFVHGYDLGKLFISALQQVDLQKPMKEIRQALKNKLEQLDTPIIGLIKTYQTPFTRWSPELQSAHEALAASDLCMGRFRADGSMALSPSFEGQP